MAKRNQLLGLLLLTVVGLYAQSRRVYYVVVGSSQQQRTAIIFRDTYRQNGYPNAQVIYIPERGAYRVYLGRHTDYQSALQLQRNVRRNANRNAWIAFGDEQSFSSQSLPQTNTNPNLAPSNRAAATDAGSAEKIRDLEEKLRATEEKLEQLQQEQVEQGQEQVEQEQQAEEVDPTTSTDENELDDMSSAIQLRRERLRSTDEQDEIQVSSEEEYSVDESDAPEEDPIEVEEEPTTIIASEEEMPTPSPSRGGSDRSWSLEFSGLYKTLPVAIQLTDTALTSQSGTHWGVPSDSIEGYLSTYLPGVSIKFTKYFSRVYCGLEVQSLFGGGTSYYVAPFLFVGVDFLPPDAPFNIGLELGVGYGFGQLDYFEARKAWTGKDEKPDGISSTVSFANLELNGGLQMGYRFSANWGVTFRAGYNMVSELLDGPSVQISNPKTTVLANREINYTSNSNNTKIFRPIKPYAALGVSYSW